MICLILANYKRCIGILGPIGVMDHGAWWQWSAECLLCSMAVDIRIGSALAVYVVVLPERLTVMVARNEPYRLALDMPAPRIGSGGNWCWLSAATLTQLHSTHPSRYRLSSTNRSDVTSASFGVPCRKWMMTGPVCFAS